MEKIWIDHTTSGCPMQEDSMIFVVFKNNLQTNFPVRAVCFNWSLNTLSHPFDVKAYSIAKDGNP